MKTLRVLRIETAIVGFTPPEQRILLPQKSPHHPKTVRAFPKQNEGVSYLYGVP
ncbi:MAG: hypothetical protein ACI81P_003532 [Neolewinella sp.]|jgi:hypothetical protein